jgi:2-amino-4-hydroxy-6-hydroxymethyldihydropteridine diphosphokinase
LTVAYLALGSNIGDRLAHLQLAVDTLASTPGIDLIAVSPVYETTPVGGPVQDDYYNAVVEIDTELDAWALLAVAQVCEIGAHRVRNERWGPRTLDVDILLYDDLELDEPELTIPHPRMWQRDFVLAPLADIAPDRVSTRGPWKGVQKAAVQLRFSRDQ